MKLYGLSGFARSGKDTFAEVLIEEGGYTRIAFADKLREVLYALEPIVAFGWTDRRGIEFPQEAVYLSNVIDRYGWDGYKETKFGSEIRRLLQRLGTEAARKTLGEDIWVDAALNDLNPEGKYVVPDARFLNEALAIKERGGLVIRIDRAGVGPANNHSSETGLDDFDFDHRIENSGTLEEYRKSIVRFANENNLL